MESQESTNAWSPRGDAPAQEFTGTWVPRYSGTAYGEGAYGDRAYGSDGSEFIPSQASSGTWAPSS